MENFNNLIEADFLVPVPRGSEDAPLNHMLKIGEKLSEKVNIPVCDPLTKKTDYTSQKEIDDSEDRKENVKDKFESERKFKDNPTIVLLDDVATSCGTLKFNAKALREAGAKKVFGLAIARSEPLNRLESAEIYTPDQDDDD